MIQKTTRSSSIDDKTKSIDAFNTFMIQNGGYVRVGGQVQINPNMDKMDFDALLTKYKTLQGKRSKK